MKKKIHLGSVNLPCFIKLFDLIRSLIKQRIEQITAKTNHTTTVKLSSFIGSSLKENGISFALSDYLELADWTARIERDDKRGFIEALSS